EVVARAEAVRGEDPAHANEGPAQERHLRVERDRLAATDLEIELEVILQVLAHSGQVAHYVDAESGELTGRPDARELEQLRGVDGTRAEEHLALGQHLVRAASALVADPGRPAAVEQHAAAARTRCWPSARCSSARSEEHTSEL